jgi:hypothetical protein
MYPARMCSMHTRPYESSIRCRNVDKGLVVLSDISLAFCCPGNGAAVSLRYGERSELDPSK